MRYLSTLSCSTAVALGTVLPLAPAPSPARELRQTPLKREAFSPQSLKAGDRGNTIKAVRRGAKGNINFSATLEYGPFSRSRHKVWVGSEHPNAEDNSTRIDGESIWGVDENLPSTENRSLSVTIGSKQIVIPRARWHDLYEVNGGKDFGARWDSKRRAVIVWLYGGCAWFIYKAQFVVPLHGKIRRSVKSLD